MIDVILAIAKYSGLFISNFYGYLKLARIKIRPVNLIEPVVAVVFATGLYYATKRLRLLIPMILLLMTFVYLLIRYRQPIMNTATYSVIACGVTIVGTAFAFIVSVPLGLIAFGYIADDAIRSSATIITTSALQLIFVFLIYKIKRFKNGLSLQKNDGYIELLIFISIICIIFLTLFYTDYITHSPGEIIILAFIFFGLGLFSWWKKHVTNTYRKQVQKRNEAIYEQRIQEYENERKQLLEQNEKLSKIIHRDNKLIPAMVIAVEELAASSGSDEKLNGLTEQLSSLASEHKQIIENYRSQYDNLPKTDVVALDAVLRYVYSRAQQNHVELKVNVVKESVAPLLSAISEPCDLSTILCDMSENAIIASRTIPDGRILISFELSASGVPVILFCDNGELFDEKVIANMGRNRITTHAAEGGSGIGLMTLFEILNKYNASFCLDEIPETEGYNKLIKLTFDNLRKQVIITRRESIKKICASRNEFTLENK